MFWTPVYFTANPGKILLSEIKRPIRDSSSGLRFTGFRYSEVFELSRFTFFRVGDDARESGHDNFVTTRFGKGVFI